MSAALPECPMLTAMTIGLLAVATLTMVTRLQLILEHARLAVAHHLDIVRRATVSRATVSRAIVSLSLIHI